MKPLLSLILFLTVLLALTVSGCTGGDVPKCDNETVQDLVMEISFERFRDRLTEQVIIDETGMAQQMNLTYAQWVAMKDRDPGIPKILQLVDERIKTMSISSIRTTGEAPEVHRCSCAADLQISTGQGIPITYTAQYTDDGKEVYVEVSGLK